MKILKIKMRKKKNDFSKKLKVKYFSIKISRKE
jgi:hypothetical protein